MPTTGHKSRIPGATYRLQLTRDFGFARAAEVIDYLDALGVDTLYLSPILAARAESLSNYDVVDPCRLDSKLGYEAEFLALAEVLHRHGMGLLLDIVPNHMAASWENPMWNDVLMHGRRSEHAAVFDIDWDAGAAVPGEEPRVLLPVLGAPYAEILERGEIRIEPSDDGFVARYYEHCWPIAPRTAGQAAALVDAPDAVALAALLDAQFYQLGHFRVGAHKINYRRFFDINDLVGVRVEDDDVFDLTHGLVLLLARRGIVTGIRVDHIDGMRDPWQYLTRLRAALPTFDAGHFYVIVEKILSAGETLPDDWPVHGTTGYEFVRALSGVFVDPHGLGELEHIYARFVGFKQPFQERLYQQKKRVIRDLFPREIGRRAEVLCRLALRDPVARDVPDRDLEQALVEVLACFPVYRTYVRDEHVTDEDRRVVAAAVAEARARNVLVPEAAYDFVARVLTLELLPSASGAQRAAWLELVLGTQQATGPIMAKGLEDTALYQDFRLLSLNSVGGEPDPPRGALSVDAFHRHNRDVRARWPHTLVSTSTHDSKRSEDVRARLHVLADLPAVWARALARWSNLNARHKVEVGGLEVPSRNEEVLIYQTLLGAWPLGDDRRDELVDRLLSYVIKASREAKLHTSWLEVSEAYEQALVGFVRAIVDERVSRAFLIDFRAFERRIAFYGAINGLSQVLLKITSPGVPDFYQGTELWTFTLVDPDNRRLVDFGLRRRLLCEILAATARPEDLCRELLDTWQDGRVKLYVTQRALHVRRGHGELFAEGDYVPLGATGARAGAVCAFARGLRPGARQGLRGDPGEAWAMTVVPMHVGTLTPADTWPLGAACWRDTALALPEGAPRTWRNVLTGAVVEAESGGLPLREVLRAFPVALLEALPG